MHRYTANDNVTFVDRAQTGATGDRRETTGRSVSINTSLNTTSADRVMHARKMHWCCERNRANREYQMSATSVLISMIPMWGILLVASGTAAYLVFWRKVIK
jgi:hypothetical protein